ncbi:TatD family [Penicillium macrosclerotiorum]|uniref:TatD family n=1 Tax=Penicillium macrosclerotiorum TaxID=303699 RepID=UPI0025499BDD|nr:TatD family [Penicillium macrosclerotiorum]KAJ5669845.1 TatD family [Penicillium macrosclerotiorum]
MTLGVHPYHASELFDGEICRGNKTTYLDSLEEMGEMLLAEESTPLAAFLEIGLNYVFVDPADKQIQRRAFRDRLELATHF